MYATTNQVWSLLNKAKRLLLLGVFFLFCFFSKIKETYFGENAGLLYGRQSEEKITSLISVQTEIDLTHV